ncbi:MAG: hypothetical protein JWM59_2143 [Verrucomicrobiales bacterium]|nr:hypothetical protein [Verrucomicrobiales bacterium]
MQMGPLSVMVRRRSMSPLARLSSSIGLDGPGVRFFSMAGPVRRNPN